jgi:hypothetical protein
MCENMTICVKIWVSLDICVNVWKYGHLCENFTFIGYFYEICSMCENMAVSEVCTVSWSLVFSFWWSVCSFLKSCVQFLVKQKGDAPTEHASRILVKGDVPTERVSRILVKGGTRCAGAPPFLLNMHTKKESQQNIPHRTPPGLHTRYTCSVQSGRGQVEHKLFSIFMVLWLSWV